MLSDPTVFGNVYFVTYLPAQGTASACGQAGDSFIYSLDFLTGYGAGQYAGQGISSSILVSISPNGTANLYFPGMNAPTSAAAGNTSGGGNGTSVTMPSSRTNILYWQDQRLNQ
jgi:hypothetical protein